MNRELGQPIAYGRTAEVYAWEEGFILKLFYDWYGLEAIEYEARISRLVFDGGLPVPAVGEIIRVNGRNGLVYQRLSGIPMARMFAKKPWRILSLSRRMAELHAQMHAAAAEPDLPSQRERLREKISTAQALPADLRANALTALDSLPDGDRLCHGDFHPMNILVTREGETIIDWVDTTRGNPVADLARTSIILIGDADGKQGRSALERRLIRLIHGAYIQKYFQLQPGSRAEYRRWLPVVAAARLSENILEVEDLLLAQARALSDSAA